MIVMIVGVKGACAVIGGIFSTTPKTDISPYRHPQVSRIVMIVSKILNSRIVW
jgi:hypothetical protein